MTCSTCDDLYVKWCEISQRCGIWKGHHHIWSVVLVGANTMIITKNGTDETTTEYDILYITRTSFLCRFRIWSQNSNILSVASDMAHFMWINTVNDHLATADVPTVITVSPAVRSLSYMYKVWIKRACIKFPSIACDGNPPVTHGDFDDISPIWGYHHQYHCAMHVTHHIWWA